MNDDRFVPYPDACFIVLCFEKQNNLHIVFSHIDIAMILSKN